MRLKCHSRIKDGKEHRYWSVVESVRCSRERVVQRPVLYLGELNDSQRAGWTRCRETVAGQGRAQQIALFPADRALPVHAQGFGVQVRLEAMRLERPRQWGACGLFRQMWEQLRLDEFWKPLLPESREGTSWYHPLVTSCAYRLIDPGSEPSGARQTATQEQPRRGKPPVRRRINGGCTGCGSDRAPWRTCSARIFPWPQKTTSTACSTNW